MENALIMDLIKEVRTDLKDIKEDQNEMKIVQATQSIKLDDLKTEFNDFKTTLKTHIEAKSAITELLSSSNGKYIIGGLIVVSVLVVSIFNPAVLGWVSTLIPFLK